MELCTIKYWRDELIRQSGRLLLSASVALLLLASIGCSLEKPEAPTWTVAARVPIADRLYDIRYLVEHANRDEIVWDSVQGAQIKIERSMAAISIGNSLKFNDTEETFAEPVGGFQIVIDDTASAEIALNDLYSGPLGLIAAFSAGGSKSLTPMADFVAADVTSGVIRLTVDNQLGLSLDSVTVTVDSGVLSIGTISIPGPIAHGETAQGQLPLDGFTLGNDWSIDFVVHTPGGVWLSTSEPKLTLLADVPEPITVSSATGRVAALARVWDDTVAFGDRHRIGRASFVSGSLELRINNPMPLPFNFDWSSPSLTRGGQVIAGTGSVASHGMEIVAIDLSDVEFQSLGGDSRWLINMSVTSDGSGEESVTMDATAEVSCQVAVSDITLSSLEGVLDQSDLVFHEESEPIDWSDGVEETGIADGVLRLSLVNELGVPAEFSGTIQNDRGVALPVNGSIAPGSSDSPVTTELTFSDISALVHPVPQSIVFDGSLTYGDGTTRGAVNATDRVVATLTFVGPLSLYINNLVYDADPTAVELSEDNEGFNWDDRLGAARLVVEATNHLPVGAAFTIHFSNNASAVGDSPALVLGPAILERADVDNNGHVLNARNSQMVFEISENDMPLFEQDLVWIQETVELNGPDAVGVPARFAAGDFVDWHAWLELDVRLGKRD